jgi:sugar phosphate permease
VFAFAAAATPGYTALGIMLLLGGMAAASTSAASGRVVIGWFPRSRRGLAMGIRQMSQPLGVAAAALVVPPLASHLGIWAPLLLAGGVTAVLAVACGLGIANPPRPAGRPAAGTPRPVNPYREGPFLARIHVLSALLVVPQFTLSTFGLIWLVASLHWNAAAAGAVIAVAQFVGAFCRILVGVLSDRVGSRTRVLRWVAVSGVVVRQGTRHPEHRPVHRRLRGRPRHRRAHHRRRLPRRVRPRRAGSPAVGPARSRLRQAPRLSRCPVA